MSVVDEEELGCDGVGYFSVPQPRYNHNQGSGVGG
jgi:hypothetical protein